MQFQKAERRQAKLKIALTGPSGAGKTYSALALASGMGKRIGLIDSENGSARLYSKVFDFDELVLQPPYTISRYLEAMKLGVSAGYDVLVVDSISHAWAGDGGILDKKSRMDAGGGNSYTNWAKFTPEQEAFKAYIVNANVHLICTMRSKQEYVLEMNERGKQAPRKVGMAPIQREGMEYEFTTVFDVGMDHSAQVSKDRTGLFDGRIFTITPDTGAEFVRWLNGAKPEETAPPAPEPAPTPASPDPAPPAEPTPAPMTCEKCTSELRLHATGVGYICPNAQSRGDGHSRVAMAQQQS